MRCLLISAFDNEDGRDSIEGEDSSYEPYIGQALSNDWLRSCGRCILSRVFKVIKSTLILPKRHVYEVLLCKISFHFFVIDAVTGNVHMLWRLLLLWQNLEWHLKIYMRSFLR